VLNLIKMVVEAAHQHQKWVGVCGELAGDPLAVPVLVGLGVDELSLNPGGIPKAKQVIREITLESTQELAEQVCQAASAPEARRLVEAYLQKHQK